MSPASSRLGKVPGVTSPPPNSPSPDPTSPPPASPPPASPTPSRRPPLVAVVAPRLRPGRVTSWPGAAEAVQVEYSDGLRRAGGVPVAIGVGEHADPAAYLARFDGLLLVGGPDVDPAFFGEEKHPEVYGIDRLRDELEIGLCHAALAAGAPILAICRGIQVLNVALGGTLHQHLPDLGLPVAHGVPAGSSEPAHHSVEVTAGSRLAGLVGATTVEDCVSIHHQAVRDVAPGLVATAWSADGVVEAIETPPGGPWCVAIQWHPERSAETDPVQQRIFDEFVAEVVRSEAAA